MKLKSQKGNPLGSYLVSVLLFLMKKAVDMNVFLNSMYVIFTIEIWRNIPFKVCRVESIVKI